MLRVRPTGGIAEFTIGHTQFARLYRHLPGECLFTAGETFCNDDRCVISRLHDNAADQVFHSDTFANLDKHLRPALLPGFAAHPEFIV